MNRVVLACGIGMFLLAVSGCALGWKLQHGPQTLPEVNYIQSTGTEPSMSWSRRAELTLPDGWRWVMRGNDYVATRDGVYVQNITVERFHVDQVTQSDDPFPQAAISSKQWPIRTVPYLKKRLAPGLAPLAVADAVLASRANNAGVTGFEIKEVTTRAISGYQGFRAVYEFSLEVMGRKTPYRTLTYGFLLDDWYYGMNYSAARRYYFQKDADAFDAVVRSVRLVER
ncbi:MAG TPA: hypothetical protein VLY45_01050 [Nitrospiria bacterium]|nr:hypothetical protein [Nitrospiria bacterium]